MISDLDEIPCPNAIQKLDYRKKIIFFKQRNFYYKFNLANFTTPYSFGTRVCKKLFLQSPQWLRNIKPDKLNFFIKILNSIHVIEKGGWHFSYIKKSEDILKKIKSFAHGELNTDNFTIKMIDQKIKNHKDLFDRNFVYSKINIDNSYPEYFQKNILKYKDWIL